MSRRMSFSEDREYLLTVIKLENEELFSLVASVATIVKAHLEWKKFELIYSKKQSQGIKRKA